MLAVSSGMVKRMVRLDKELPVTEQLPVEFLQKALGQDGQYAFTFSPQERRIFRRQKWQSPTKWAPKNFKVPYGPFESRYFSFEVTPHLWGMLEAFARQHVRKIAVCAAPQTTKTTFAHVATAWAAIFEPGPVIHCYPTEASGIEIMEERIQRAFRESPPLAKLMTGRKEDVSRHKLRLVNQWIRLAWAGSVTSTAHRSARIYVADEVDKYLENPNASEASTLDLLKLRARAYGKTSKGLVLSSTTIEQGFIWREVTQESQAVFVYWSTCPYCEQKQLMDFGPDTWIWPHGDDGHSVPRKEILSRKSARYVCVNPGCKREWDDDARDKAQRLSMRGGWRLRTEDGSMGQEMMKHLETARPSEIAFIVPSWISYFVSLSEVAHDYLKTKDKNLSPEEQFLAYKHFQNAHRSLPWKVELQAQPVDKLLEFCDDRPEGVAPGGGKAATLLAAVDTQDNGQFFLSVWAIGWGFQNEQWLVLRREAHSFDEVAAMLWHNEYYDTDGLQHYIEVAAIDMLGHRTKEVLEFCLQYEGLIIPYFGSAREMGSQSYTWSNREYIPGTDKPLPNGGLRAMRVNSKFFKDAMAVKLSLDPDTPGCVHFFRDVGEEYCKQLTSESRDEKGKWKQLGARPNHYWDNWMAVNALAEWLCVKLRPQPDENEAIETKQLRVVAAQSSFMWA